MRVPHGITLDRPVTITANDGETWNTWAARKTFDAETESIPGGIGKQARTTAEKIVYTVRFDPRLKVRMKIQDRSETTSAQVIRNVEHVGRRRYTLLTTYRGWK